MLTVQYVDTIIIIVFLQDGKSPDEIQKELTKLRQEYVEQGIMPPSSYRSPGNIHIHMRRYVIHYYNINKLRIEPIHDSCSDDSFYFASFVYHRDVT